MVLGNFRLSTFLWLGYFGVFQVSNTQTNKKCPRSPSFGNGHVQASQTEQFIGRRVLFKCAPGFIIGNEREADLVCTETSWGPQWVWPLDPKAQGCQRGCLNQDDCDWGMVCDSVSRKCQYLTCPAQLPNALLAFHPRQNGGIGLENVIGQFATLSCLPGYFVQHPDSFVTLARTGFKLKDYNVQVQCQLLENNKMAWVLLYRQSSGMTDSVYGDILHTSDVPVQCLEGCRSDAGCPLLDTCYEKQCLPKVCPPQILAVPNSVLLKARSAKVGTIVKARCNQGFVIKEIGFNRPFDVKCEQNKDLRKSPAWVLRENKQFHNLKCVPKGSCSENDDCPGDYSNVWRCVEGTCVQDCADVPNGKIVQERHISSETGEETCVADDEPSFSISHKAKLQCQEGYIVDNPISEGDNAKVVCHQDAKGSRWRYLSLLNQVAECIRGCQHDSDCPMAQVCSRQTSMCQPSTCQDLDPNQYHGQIVSTSAGPDFVCDPGFVYLNALDQVANATKVVCGREENPSASEQVWLEFQGQRDLRPCQPGCLDDLGCGFEEHCHLRLHTCRPSSCPCLTQDPNAIIMDCQSSRVEAFASVQIKCNPGYLFNLPLQPQKSMELVCNPITQRLSHESSMKGQLVEPPICEPGCFLDSDCPKAGEVCRKRLCKARSCADGILDPNAMYNHLPRRNQAVKFCHRGFKMFDGATLTSNIQLECNSEDNSHTWRTSNGQEDPPCLELCSNATNCSNPNHACQGGACMKTKCNEDISNGQVESKGSSGVLVCSPGFVVKTSQGCNSEATVQCDSNMASNWMSGGEIASCQSGCSSNESCLKGEECDPQTCRCVPPVCFGPKKLIGGSIEGPDEIRLGMTVTLTCSRGFIIRRNNQASKSARVQCGVFNGIPRYAILGIPIQGCEEGCLSNADCSLKLTCQEFKCVDVTCSLEDPNALLDSPGGLRPAPFPIRIRCKPGTIMNVKPTIKKEVEVLCEDSSNQLHPSLSLSNGEPLPRCTYGCANDWDCPVGKECSHGECLNPQRCQLPYSNKNGRIQEHFQKYYFKCLDGYRLHSGSIAIEVECIDYAQDWALSDGRPLPWCCECPKFGKCVGHCPQECPVEIFKKRSEMTIVAELGNLVGSPAALHCQPGYILSGDNFRCSKTTNITCGFDQWFGPYWTSVEHGLALPTCIKLVNKCCTTQDCLEDHNCVNSTCVPMQCANDLTKFHGTLVNPRDVGVGTTNLFRCLEDSKETTTVFCSLDQPPSWKLLDGTPLRPCFTECSEDKYCPKDRVCDPEIKRCKKSKGCPLTIPNGIIVPLRDNLRKIILCKPGFKLVPDVEELAVCSNDEVWTTPQGQAMSCKPGCSFRYPCSEGQICINGKCSPKVLCPSGIPFSNGHLVPEREGQLGDVVVFECDLGYVQLETEILELECSKEGWMPRGPVTWIPQCQKESDSCPSFDSAIQAHFDPIVRELNLFQFNCLKGKMQSDGLIKGVAKCINGKWFDLSGKPMSPCNNQLKCKKSTDCSIVEKCIDGECLALSCDSDLEFPNSDLVVEETLGIGSSGMLVCKDDFVLDSSDDVILFQAIYCGFDQNTGDIEWLSQSTSDKVEDCVKGCKTHDDCSTLCAKGRCAVASDSQTLCSSFPNFDGTTECKGDICILECPIDQVIIDPNVRPPLMSSLVVQCKIINDSGQWIVDNERVLTDPKCVPIRCTLCDDNFCQESDLCGKSCSLDHVPTHLEVVQTTGDGSADFSCSSANHRLLQYFWNKHGNAIDSFLCLGSVFTSRCEIPTSSSTTPVWSKLSGSEMPICAKECSPNKSDCQCSALDFCQTKCATCIPDTFEPCSKRGGCSDWSKSCDINPRLSQWQCLPKCKTRIHQGTVHREPNGRSVLQCDFHFTVDHLKPRGPNAYVTCSYSTCQPLWTLVDPEHAGKPASCVFDPAPCNHRDLMFIPNAKIQFQDGTLNFKARKFTRQWAQVRCNNYHLLKIHGKILLQNPKVAKMSCQSDKGVPEWTLSDGMPFQVGALRCEEGCVTNADCHNEGYYCDGQTNTCVHSPCTKVVRNGDITFVATEGQLTCHPGHVIAYPRILVQKAFIACQQQNRCDILPTKRALIKCQHYQEDSGHWMLAIQPPNQFQKWKTTSVAECVPGCKADVDCSRGLKCVPLNPNCRDCIDKYCVQTTCSDLDPSYHGRVVYNKYICDQLFGHPGEKDPSLEVSCSLNPRDSSLVWISRKTNAQIAPCLRKCRTFRDCAEGDDCNTEGYCYPKDCPLEPNGGKIQVNPKTGPTFTCPKGWILILGEESRPGDMAVYCSKHSDSIPTWKSVEKPDQNFVCKPGCRQDKDCTYPKTCHLPSGFCSVPKCPDLFVRNSDLKAPMRNGSLGTTFEIHCKEGFVIPKQEARRVKCILGAIGPIWTTEDNESVQDCVPGCGSCSDCQANEECFHHVCVPLTCSQSEIESYRRLECSNEQYSIGATCRFKTTPGFVVGRNLTKSGSAKCVQSGDCDPHNRRKRSAWTLPEIIPGCHPEAQEEDCQSWEECRIDLGNQCQLKRCPLKVDHGTVTDVGQSALNDSKPRTSGQFGTLRCSPGFAIGYDSTLSTSRAVPQMPWIDESPVECLYLKGKYPLWSTYGGIPVDCFKVCQDQSDCSILEICSRSRCIPGKCKVPPSSALFEPCSKMQQSLTNLPIGSSSNYCCKPGYISDTESPSKTFRLVCEKDHANFPVLSQEPTCEIGCTLKTESQDCLRNQICVDHQCQDLLCEEPIPGNAHIQLFDSKAKGVPIGTRGVLHCEEGFIYPLPNGGHSHFVPVGCVRSPVDQSEGQWSLLWQSDHAIGIKECVPGCILDEDCPPTSFCNSDLQCELLKCPITIEGLDNGQVDAKERTLGTFGNIQCHKGFFRKGEDSPLVKCCYSDSCFSWGNPMDCSRPKVECLSGCKLDEDCLLHEECVEHECQTKVCVNKDEKRSSILKDRRLVQALLPDTEGIKICKEGHLMHGSLKLKPAVCQVKEGLANLIDYEGRSLPNCLRVCLNDMDCQLDQERCIKGVCIGECSIPDIRNAVPNRNGPKHIPLGSELTVRCQPGYLDFRGSQESNFACQPTSQGPKLCPKLGKCHDPICIEATWDLLNQNSMSCFDSGLLALDPTKRPCPCSRGCRTDHDCVDPRQICISGSFQCSSPACCERITCSMTYEVDPRTKFGPLSKSSLLDEATLICPDGMVFQPQSGHSPSLQPTSTTKATCVQTPAEGKWITNPKDLRCVEGCNRHERPCQKPCHQCDVTSWQCVPSGCSKFIQNGRLLSQETQLGLQVHALCNQGSYAKAPEEETLEAVIQLKCKCLEQVPRWTWRPHGVEDVPFDGCRTEFCQTDEDCSDDEICSEHHQCQALQCDSSIPGLSGDLILSLDGQIYLVCHKGFAVEDINNATITTRIPVECVHKVAERKMIWIPKGHQEYAYHDHVKCDFGCQSDMDCNPNENCQNFLANETIKHCVPWTCSKPYKQTHGGVVGFPTAGLLESEHIEFQCHPGYGIEPSRLSPFVRTSLQIFCLRNAEPGIGIRLGYFLQNGAQVPICSRGVCSKQEDCFPDEICFQNTCSVRACSNISPVSNSHLTNPSKRSQVSESTKIQCNQGHVIRWNGKCVKELGMTCFLPEHPKGPIWLPSSNPVVTNAQPSCQKGCSIDSDCRPFESCDQSQCACLVKACPSTIPFGILLDIAGITEGYQGRILCQGLKDPIPVICQSTPNGEALWYDEHSRILAKCPRAFPERCEVNDESCPRGFKCQEGMCSPPVCSTMEQGIPKYMTLGERLENKCPSGSIRQDGTDLKYLYCLWNGEKAALDFLEVDKDKHCVPGCLSDENCEPSESCQSGMCSTLSCHSNLMGNGGIIVPRNGTLLGSNGILACERGFLVEGQKTAPVVCNSEAQWTVPGSQSTPKCDPGCVNDRDCSVMEQCVEKRCIPKSCPEDLTRVLNAEHVSPSNYLSRTKMACKKGFQIPGFSQTILEIQCEADEISPIWRTPEGFPLPSCLQPCSEGLCKEQERCDPLLGYCLPLQCDNKTERNYGTLVRVGEDFKEGSLHLFQCDPGFRLNPTRVNGEHMENVTVLCHKNVILNSLDWTLPDGRLVPECIPGCLVNEDCDFNEFCDHHDCVPSHCSIPKLFSGHIILENAINPIGSSSSSSSLVPIGTRGLVQCDPGYYPHENTFPNSVDIYCQKETNKDIGTFEDQFGKPLKSCHPGCKRDGNCPMERPKCNLKESKCVQCLLSEDCSKSGEICSDHGTCCKSERSNVCSSDRDCQSATMRTCDLLRSICVECKEDRDCLAQNEICAGNGTCQVPCFFDKECPLQDEVCSKGKCLAKEGQCLVDQDCSPSRPICSPWTKECVECTANGMCQNGQCQNGICLNVPQMISPVCKVDSDCKGVESVCDKASGNCVICLDHTHCSHSDKTVCIKSKKHFCTQCSNSDHCHASQRCITSDGTCRRVCSKDLQCSKNEKCAFLGHCSLKCNHDRDCRSGLMCHPQEKTCVSCYKSEDCPMERPVCFQGDCYETCSKVNKCAIGFCDPVMDICRAECLNDDQCVGSSARKKCHPKSQLCFECLSTTDCDDNQICFKGSCEKGCLEHSDCRDPQPICDKDSNKCVECLSAPDCNSNAPFCNEHKCQANECSIDKDCSKRQKCLGGTCRIGCREDHECQIPNRFCHKPSHSCHECLANQDCPRNHPLCVDGECEQCVSDEGCPSGFHCRANNCHEGCLSDLQCRFETRSRCDIKTKTCVQCLTLTDCPLLAPVCSQGKCIETCKSHKDCPAQLMCIAHKCTEGCEKNSDCSDLQPVCDREQSVCVRCTMNQDCPPMFPYCRERECFGTCVEDSECLPGSVCLSGTCIQGCKDFRDCFEPTRFCEPGKHQCVQCLDSSTCPLNRPKCLEHICQGGCSTDADCSNDSPICDRGSRICVQCRDQWDCPDSKPNCAQNQCQGCDANKKPCRKGFICRSGTCLEGCENDQDCPAGSPICDLTRSQCVECRVYLHCPREHFCSQGRCVGGCESDDHCSKSKPRCELSSQSCQKCLESNDCPQGAYCSDFQCSLGCESDLDCQGEFKHCFEPTSKCSECVTNEHCSNGQYCKDFECQSGCNDDSHCPQQKPKCDTRFRMCVECQRNNDCDPGFRCTQGTCSDKCTSTRDCFPSHPYCNGLECVQCLEHSHCGPKSHCNGGQCLLGCKLNGNCPKSTPKCLVSSKTCVVCLKNDDCSKGERCNKNHACTTQCETDQDCIPIEMICHDQTCVPCSKSAHCPEGFFCENFHCQKGCSQNLDCPTQLPVCDLVQRQCHECLASSDCLSSLHCRANKCTDSCQQDSDCTDNTRKVCSEVSKKCIECRSHSDCPVDKFCSGSKCLKGCRDDSSCLRDVPVCDKSSRTCVQCLDQSHCPIGSFCMDHSCSRDCSKDGDCIGKWKFCQDGQCQECTSSAHCPKGDFCSNMSCKPGCGSSQDCFGANAVCDLSRSQCVACLSSSNCPRGSFCQDQTCIQGCRSNKDCARPLPACDVAKSLCVECLASPDCNHGFHCRDQMCHAGCGSDSDCPDESKPFCKSSECVQCVTHRHCSSGLMCHDDQCTDQCQLDRDCSVFPATPVCAQELSKCVRCSQNAHCQAGEFCADYDCHGGCLKDEDCSPPEPYCDHIAHNCQECLNTKHCSPGFYCKDYKCIKGCQDASNCPPSSPHCNTSTNRCHSIRRFPKYCQGDADCFAPKPFCTDHKQCVACIRQMDCPRSNPYCKEGRCSECQTPRDCSAGMVCRHGFCKPPNPNCHLNKDCPTALPNCDKYLLKCVQCFTKRDCAPTEYCNFGDCIPDDSFSGDIQVIDPSCRSNRDCPKDMTCQDGQCLSGPIKCRLNIECPKALPNCDKYTWTCVECFTQDDCKSGQFCDHNACVRVEKLPPTRRCRTDRQCPPDQKCQRRTCKAARRKCTLNEDCPSQMPHCDKYLQECVQCSTNKDCSRNQFCDHGDCVI